MQQLTIWTFFYVYWSRETGSVRLLKTKIPAYSFSCRLLRSIGQIVQQLNRDTAYLGTRLNRCRGPGRPFSTRKYYLHFYP